MQPRNIFAELPVRLAAEEIVELLRTPALRLERIVSTGQAGGAWLDQDWAEWVVVLTGAARLDFKDGETVALAPGDAITIPAHRRHRVAWTDPAQPTLWLALHYTA